jgi:hypothetical protein
VSTETAKVLPIRIRSGSVRSTRNLTPCVRLGFSFRSNAVGPSKGAEVGYHPALPKGRVCGNVPGYSRYARHRSAVVNSHRFAERPAQRAEYFDGVANLLVMVVVLVVLRGELTWDRQPTGQGDCERDC